jgi:hypothetical protein
MNKENPFLIGEVLKIIILKSLTERSEFMNAILNKESVNNPRSILIIYDIMVSLL